jgi:peptidoglycan/LPS O-acetylase OafA/YrhL
MSGTKSGQLDTVQALRGLAALLVMLAHLGGLGSLYPSLPAFGANHGVIGVDIFFVISGFIMAHTTRQSWGLVGRFVYARVTRIYPLWWLCLLIEAPIVLSYLTGFWDEYGAYYIKSLLLLPATNPGGEPYPVLSPGWTLIYEMMFYGVFAAVMTTARAGLTIKITASLLSLFLLASILPSDLDITVYLRNPVYFEFAFGVALANIYARRKISGRFLLCLLVASIVAALTYSFGQSARFIFYGVPATLCVATALYVQQQGWRVPAFARWLGDVSYPLYLLQSIVMFRVTPIVLGWNVFPGFMTLVLIAVLCIAASAATHYLFERPMINVLKLKKRPATTAAQL